MSEREIYHDSQADREGESDGEEVVFREDIPRVENFTPPTHNESPQTVTANDLDVVIEGWERKFQHLSESIRDIQLAREGAQERRIQEMHEGLTQFLERCDPAHHTAPRRFETPVVSTPFTPSGAPSRLRPDFDFDSPVNQSPQKESTRNNRIDENRDHHDARDRSRDHRSNERLTQEDDRGDIGDVQRNSYHSGMNNSVSRPSSSPKVPTFDGTVSAQFRPWIIQFEAIACHQCWTLGEIVVRLVASLTGPAANLLIGMTMGQLDDYAFLVVRLYHRYDPPEREEAHRAELCARTRRQNESADEFTENLKNLAQRAYTHADQNMLDNLVVERFREGHSNEELKKHLCLCPSTGLQDLIGVCVRFETHVEIGTHANKSNEGLYTVQGSNCQS